MEARNTYRSGPDERGHFGIYGGQFVAETLMSALDELTALYDRVTDDPEFQAELAADLQLPDGRSLRALLEACPFSGLERLAE